MDKKEGDISEKADFLRKSLDQTFEFKKESEVPLDQIVSKEPSYKEEELQKMKMEMMRRETNVREQYLKGTREEKEILREDLDAPVRSMLLMQNIGFKEGMDLVQKLDKAQENIMIKNADDTFRFAREMKLKGPNLWSFLKRGMIGVDAYFLGFAILGTLMIPLYYWRKQRKIREKIRNREFIPVAPHEVDEYSDELEEISLNTTYYNTQVIKERQRLQKMIDDEKAKLKKTIDDPQRKALDRAILYESSKDPKL